LAHNYRKNIIAYVDDIVVMSKNEEDHIADLKETFANLREAGLKLNPDKCVFGVSQRKMLRYIIGPKGIRANPKKTNAIISMVEPSTKKEVQKLTRKNSSIEQIHLKISRAQPPILQSSKRRRQGGMGTRAVGGLPATQKLHG
jgi:hypothetical protein